MGAPEIISLVAILVAVVSLWISYVNSKNQKALSLYELEWLRIQIAGAQTEYSAGRKASLSARMYQIGKTDWRIKLFNRGPSDAFNVRVELNDDNEFLRKNEVDRKLPLNKMEKGQSVEFIAIVPLATHAKEEITIVWLDSENTEKRTTVTLTL
ncbi:MAG: hypothetical protein L3J33_05435 [Rhodobacteraceae bacterium]|nr:hypothetical protein [Paracoccaceae bacterium]